MSEATAAPPGGAEPSAFREEIRRRNWTSLRIAAFIGLVLEPPYWWLDRMLLPGMDMETGVVRGLLMLFAGALFVLAFKDGGRWRRFDYEITAALGVGFASAMVAMMFMHTGYESDFFVGIVFVLLVMCFLFTWPLRVNLIFNLCWLVPFAVPFIVGTEGIDDPAVTAAHLIYLLTTVFITGISQYFRFQLERSEFEASHALEETKRSLEGALQRLKTMDRAKSNFFNNVTHELRTPLTMLLAPAEVLRRDEALQSVDGAARFVDTIWRNGLKLLKLINDLLDLSKLSDRYLRIAPIETDLVDCLEEIVEHIRPLAARKDVQLVLEVRRKPEDLHADLDLLERVVVNLVANALKFTASGGHVTIILDADETEARVAVEDNGVGIPADMLDSIFDRFTQADDSVRRTHGGTGIGLAFAREIVEVHGGRLSVESTVDVGSTFTMHLVLGNEHFRPEVIDRRRRGVAAATARRSEDREPKEWSRALADRDEYRFLQIAEVTERRVLERGGAGPGSGRVLLVEDSLEVARLVSLLLTELYDVYVARDGQQGLEMALIERPDVIITDFMMPRMDGVQLVQELRSRDETRDIPIIMLSAKTDVEGRWDASESRADVYLSKPFSPRDLVTVVGRELNRRGRAAETVLKAQTRSLEVVSAGLAHELQNPLSYIQNAFDLLRTVVDKAHSALADQDITDDVRRERLARASERLDELYVVAGKGIRRIEELVAVVRRYSREGYPSEKTEIDFDASVRDVLGLVAPKSGSRRPPTLTLAAPTARVSCIPEEMHQVIRNLVQNALDATEIGGDVRVSTRLDGDSLIFEVSDDGPGLTNEERARIFTPFYSTKAPGQGSGLGLAITQQVVRACEGTIRVRSSVGHGTSMVVTLPAVLQTQLL